MATQKGRNWSSGDIVTAANLQSIERGVSAVAEEYTPTTWANGNTVTAAALNNIEQGIANAGSSSDFSMAEVTFINNTGFSSAAYVPHCVEENALGPGSPAMVEYVVSIPDATPVVTNVPLYKGTCDGFWDTNDEQFEISVSGDAVLMGVGGILIAGDCTITISDSSGGQML